jgi:hypothetical protein
LVDWFYPRIQNYRNSHGIPIPLWHRHGSVAGFTSFGTESGTPLVLALAMAKARREGAEGGTAMAPRWESTTSSVKMDIYIYICNCNWLVVSTPGKNMSDLRDYDSQYMEG